MIIPRNLLMKSPLLQRAMCSMGFHWLRTKERYGRNPRMGFGWYSTYFSIVDLREWDHKWIGKPLYHQCRFCGHEE